MKNYSKTIFIITIILGLLTILLGPIFNIPSGITTIIVFRLLVSLTILKFPFWGTIASLLADLIDVVLADILGASGIQTRIPEGTYDRGDKILDLYYLTISFIVSLNWKEKLARVTSITLFTYRAIGVVLLEITNLNLLLFIFPNLFENFFLFWAARNKYFNKFKLTTKKLAIILLILLVPKLIQEYLLHVNPIHPWTKLRVLFGFSG